MSLPAQRAAELRREIADLEAVAAEAREAGSYTAAVQAIRGAGILRVELRRVVELQRLAASKDDAARATRMARLASLEGSWVAAERLTRQAAELRAAVEAERREREIAEREGLPTDELLDLITDAIRQLPLTDVGVIAEAVRSRIG
jgi:hypothetical protein